MPAKLSSLGRCAHLCVAHVEHFQPGGVFLGCVPDDIWSYDIALLPIALGEIDETRALRAEDIEPQA
jgi:hypothetical protein